MSKTHSLVKLYRKAKLAKGHDFSQRLVGRFYRARYAEAESDAKVEKYEFREEDHPRGQPENAGEFVEVTIGNRPGEGVHAQLQHGSRIHQPTASLPESDVNLDGLINDTAHLRDPEPKADNAAPEPSLVARTPEELASVEEALSTGKIKSGETAPGDSANKVVFVTLDNGRRGVFKPTDGEFTGGRDDIPDGTLATREVAAYEVAKIVGMTDLVPVTTMHDAGDEQGSGSLQEFCENCRVAYAMPINAMFDGPRDASRAIVFDFIMGNTDRHAGNWLIAENGKLALIDNGFMLPERHGPQTFRRMGFQHGELSSHYRKLPLSDAKTAWTEEVMDAVAAKLTELGISPAAVKMMDRRHEFLMSAETFEDAIFALEEFEAPRK